MRKTFILVVSALIWIFSVAIIVFNNLYQLANSLIVNNYLLISFVSLLIGIVLYSIINIEKLKKELNK